MANLATTAAINTTALNRLSKAILLQSTPLNRKSLYAKVESNIAHDLPVYNPSKAISGTIYTLSGVPAAGATVKLFRQADDLLCQVGVTDSGGHYMFQRDADDITAYYVLAYTSATSPQVHGVSDRGAIPA